MRIKSFKRTKRVISVIRNFSINREFNSREINLACWKHDEEDRVDIGPRATFEEDGTSPLLIQYRLRRWRNNIYGQ